MKFTFLTRLLEIKERQLELEDIKSQFLRNIDTNLAVVRELLEKQKGKK